jgi:hypothetical protein
MAGWAVAIAWNIGALSEGSEWVQQISIPYSYRYMMVSGVFWLADWVATRGSHCGALSALHAGLRDDPRRSCWYHDQDLWRPNIYDLCSRRLDPAWLMAAA